MGDGQTHSAFKRANVVGEVGNKAVEELCEIGIIKKEKSKKVFTNWSENESISAKLYFTSPFLRFWFAFVSPLFKGVRDGNYEEVQQRFINRQSEFQELIFTQLCFELIKKDFDNIKTISSYWDKENSLDIFAKTTSLETVVGMTRFTNTKLKKSDLTKLQDNCKKAHIDADIYILISKKGFSSELKALKGEKIKLYTLKDFKRILIS